MNADPNRLLVVATDTPTLEFVAKVGKSLGFNVACAIAFDSMGDEFRRIAPTAIALDLAAPIGEADAILRALSGLRCEAPIVFWDDPATRGPRAAGELCKILGLNVAENISVPLTLDALESALSRLLSDERRFSDEDVKRAIDRAQLRVHYHPKVRTTGDAWALAGAEALLRWEHPDYGLVYPNEFIDTAERCGMIGAFTDYVLQTGIDQLNQWETAGLITDLSINMSSRLVSDADFPDRLDEMLSGRGIDPGRLTIEVKESASIEQPQKTLDILTRVRLKGIDLSLDNFGTGQSSLTQLYKMPFSELKIDKTLGFDLPDHGQACTVVRALVDLAHRLGLKVCCEGIENNAALQFLRKIGCDYAQGYFLARPMTADALCAWAAEWTGPVSARKVS